jgi:uncharacterized RDD family membrane protein YckC
MAQPAAPYTAPTAWQVPPDATGPAPGVRFAGHGGRLVAYIVDGFIVGIVIAVMSVVLVGILAASTNSSGEPSGAAIGAAFVWLFVALAVSILYFPWFWARGGQTPGMRIFRLRVVRDSDGGPIGWGSAILRWIGLAIIDSIVFGIPIGLIWIFIDKRRRAWHDLIAGTIVIEQ